MSSPSTSVASLVASAHAWMEEDFDEHLALLRRWLRQPSVSGTGEGIPEMAELVRSAIVDDLDGEARIEPTDGHPIVLGRVDVGAPRTLLVYGMYDVQPVDGEEWLVDPFSGDEVDLPGFGPCIVSRGVMNSKGPLANLVSTVRTLRDRTGTLPVNLVFLVEGEEELGSVSLHGFVPAHLEELAADAALFPFYSQDRNDKVLMYLGTKGMAFFDLTVRGGDWGAPRSAGIHGMNAGWFHNPAWVLADLLSSMMSPDQTLITIDGIYDEVAPPDEVDLELLRRLDDTFDPATQLTGYDVARFKHDASGAELMRRFLFQPSLNIDGLAAGDAGDNMKTMLPHEARAKIDIRLAPGMTVAGVQKSLRDHIAKLGFQDLVDIRVRSGYPAGKSRLTDLANAPMLRAYEAAGAQVEPWPLVAGAAPLYLFTDELGIGVCMGGLGHGGGQHSPNEYATIRGMLDYSRSIVSYLYDLADAPIDHPEGL
ncbi:M20/M25/M40 family metallo-hydrolase [Microbacterium ulmi]|uniref:M20/M25/M40 family metallo-hydrolase n=1 Tax=Microbacterium ulmi TaxID=179095 RepID=A0A7Y2Q1E6_9MICO|nr:M20/M25/M40 family metallo-hydrolase [Microbacterium ulmi]NII70977.1 acetylornithine deacetylase/succinyl-diaminopimelate desuccinylase-like protein [Microbacterium ulmi]NNH04257.1 M20/M25/M40 family metallo-hydrolase [Microbacterium ulmi]